MSSAIKISGLSEASVDEKLALIDTLWESVRRSGSVPIREDHLSELERRVELVQKDPSLALSPAQARALLKRE